MASVMLLAILFTSTASWAQCKDVVWPTDPAQKAKAEESKVLYEDAKNSKQYKQAVVPLNWLLANVPQFSFELIHKWSRYLRRARFCGKKSRTKKSIC